MAAEKKPEMEDPIVEEVLEKFARTAVDTELRNYRISMYKGQDRPLNQESRRTIILERQKSQRENEIDARRGILEIINDVENSENTSDDVYKPTVYVPGFNAKKVGLSETLMFSEWMVEKPNDFHSKWLIMACPVGIRIMLVAKNGRTKTYRKSGKLHKIWNSILPGGGYYSRESKNCCILDCIWSEDTESIYILDVLMWVNQTVTDCDMDFRDSWIKSKYYEYPGLEAISDKNDFPIYLIPKYNSDKNTLNKFMMNWPAYMDNYPTVDGFLFYHKEAHYIGGTTPLVSWLYPYMVNELLGLDITVHDEYKNMKPESYVDQKSFIKEYEENELARKKQYKKRENRRSFTNTSINTSFSEDSNTSVMVFGEGNDNNISPQVYTSKKKNRSNKKNRKTKMELDVNLPMDETKLQEIMDASTVNISADTDSAISSLDDSLISDSKIDLEYQKKLEMES